MRTRLALVLLTAVTLTAMLASGSAERRPEPVRHLPAPKAPTPAPTIAADCRVTIDGQPAKLEDLRPGMEAIFILDQGVIVQIIAVTVKK